MRRLPIILTPLAAAVAATAAFVLPANSDEPMTTEQAISAARDAYPALATPIVDGPAVPSTLPTVDRAATVVGEGTLTGGGPSRTLTLTDSGEACLTVDGSSTCQPADQAATQGLFIADVACGPDATTVQGVVPDGVEDVTALGTDEPASGTAEADGSVTVAFGGDDLDGLELDNSEVAGLALQATCDAPTEPPAP
jgi:hypothetical protein